MRTLTLQMLKGLVAEKMSLEHQSYSSEQHEWSDTVLFCLFSLFATILCLGLYYLVIKFLFMHEIYAFFTTFLLSIFLSSILYSLTHKQLNRHKQKKKQTLLKNIQQRVFSIDEQLFGQEKTIYDIDAFFSHIQDLDDCIAHIHRTNKYTYQLNYIDVLKDQAAQHFREKNNIQYLSALNQVDSMVRKITPIFSNLSLRNKQQAKQRLIVVR